MHKIFVRSLAAMILSSSFTAHAAPSARHAQPAASQHSATALTAEVIERASASKVTVTKDGVERIAWSRNDVPVQIEGVPYPAAAGLGSWASFKQGRQGMMMMGDTLVFQDEVDAAMDAAFASGLEVTALHNHFFYDEPKVYFLHISGHGTPEKLAAGVKSVWDAIKSVRSVRATPDNHFPGSNMTMGQIDTKNIERITGLKATAPSESVVKVSLGRNAAMHGMSFGESMGLNTWAAFVGSSDAAAVDGDFAMTADEIQPVLKTLRAHGLHIVALHNHMVGESPKIFFTHYWGKGSAQALAEAFKAALNAQREVEKGHGG
ncbi:MAG: DUF1259 domain-containing protein [Stenotrophobium sp.]